MKKVQFITLLLLQLVAMPLLAEEKQKIDWSKVNPKNWFFSADSVSEVIVDITSVDQLLGEPIGGMRAKSIAKYMLNQAKRFNNLPNAKVSVVREGQVVKVNIPMDMLFLPNDTAVSAVGSGKILNVIADFLDEGLVNLLIATHWDNQGAPQYKIDITKKRAKAIYDAFEEREMAKRLMPTLPLSDKYPIYDNDTYETRRLNKRVTFYFLPNEAMERKARMFMLK